MARDLHLESTGKAPVVPVFRLRLSMFSLVLAASVGAAPRILPVHDAHGSWRGDQFPPVEVDREGSVREIDGVRWGFRRVDLPQGTWAAYPTRARVDLSTVRRVFYVVNPFKWYAWHSAFFFELAPGGIRNQVPVAADGTRLTSESRGLVLTFEARMRAAEEYDAGKAEGGAYRAVYNLTSWEDYRQQCVDVYGQSLRSYELALSPEERRDLFTRVVDGALAAGVSQPYRTYEHNCTTVLADWFWEVVGTRPAWPHGGRNRRAHLPPFRPRRPEGRDRIYTGKFLGWLRRHRLVEPGGVHENYRSPEETGVFVGEFGPVRSLAPPTELFGL
jgi:hypothetical protein